MLVKILFLVLLFFNNKYCFAIDIDKEKSNQIISESNFIKDDKILDEKKSDDKMIEKSIFDKVDKIEHINKIQKYKIKINLHNVGVYKECRVINPNNIKSSTFQEISSNDVTYLKKEKIKDFLYNSMIDNGISNNTAIKIKEHLEFIKKTANSNNNQPEVRKDFDTYYHKYRIDSKVQEAMVYSTLYKKQFNEIFEIFNIDSSPLLTLWGVETLFGRVIGDINILNTLYSLILMKNENKNYIDNFIAMAKLIDKHALSIDTKGSWAGAMGQCQFMPISFYNFAISLDKQKPDIIKDPIDALTSIANYLYNSGYDSSFGVLTEVSLPNHFNDCLIGFNTSKKIKEWKKLGIKSNEHNVGYEYFNNNNEHFATLIIPDFDNTLVDDNDKINAQQTKRAFLVYNNYKVLLAWNRSINFATTAGIMIEMLSKFSVKGSLN